MCHLKEQDVFFFACFEMRGLTDMFALIQSAPITPAPEECISTVAMIQLQDLTHAAIVWNSRVYRLCAYSDAMKKAMSPLGVGRAGVFKVMEVFPWRVFLIFSLSLPGYEDHRLFGCGVESPKTEFNQSWEDTLKPWP